LTLNSLLSSGSTVLPGGGALSKGRGQHELEVRQTGGGGGEERGRNGWENEERERGKKWSREKG